MYRITFALDGLDDRDLARLELQVLLDALMRADMLYLQAHPRLPGPYAAGVRWVDERPPLLALGSGASASGMTSLVPAGRVDWQDVPTSLTRRRDGTLAAGNAALAAWRAAELRVRHGVDAHPKVVVRTDGIAEWRAVVVDASGRQIADPSRGRGWVPFSDARGRMRVSFVLDLFHGDHEKELSHGTLDVLLDALMAIDALYLMRHPETPSLYEAISRSPFSYSNTRLRYMEEPPGQEDWQDVATCIRMGLCDCEDLACWRAAELAVRQGIDARPVFTSKKREDGAMLYHILTRHPNGYTEDPSKIQGMI